MSLFGMFSDRALLQKQIDDLTMELQRTKTRNQQLEEQLDAMRENNSTYNEVRELKREIEALRQSKLQLIKASSTEIERLRSFIRLMGGLDGKNFPNPINKSRRSAQFEVQPDLSQPTKSLGRSNGREHGRPGYSSYAPTDDESTNMTRTDSQRSYDEKHFTSARHERHISLESIRKSPQPNPVSVKDRVALLNVKNKDDKKPSPSNPTKRKSIQLFEEAVDTLSTSEKESNVPQFDRPQSIVIHGNPDDGDYDSPPDFGYPPGRKQEDDYDLPPFQSRTPSNTLTEIPDSGVDRSTGPKSMKERLAAYGSSVGDIKSREDDRLANIKKARELDQVKISGNKANVASMFEGLIKKKKTNVASESKEADGQVSIKSAMADPTPEKAVEAMTNMNFFQVMPDTKKIKGSEVVTEVKEGPLELLNMNNNNMMQRMSDREKEEMMDLVCQSIVSNVDLKQVQMCNASMDDGYLAKLLDALASDEKSQVTELWLESNDFRDPGFQKLAQFLKNDDTVTTVKLFGNKRDISTPVCNELLDALEENHSIVKFVYQFRFTQQKDRLEKILKRNQNEARQRRNEERRRAAGNT